MCADPKRHNRIHNHWLKFIELISEAPPLYNKTKLDWIGTTVLALSSSGVGWVSSMSPIMFDMSCREKKERNFCRLWLFSEIYGKAKITSTERYPDTDEPFRDFYSKSIGPPKNCQKMLQRCRFYNWRRWKNKKPLLAERKFFLLHLFR